MFQSLINFFIGHKVELLGMGLAISEGLALLPFLKSNSILQLIVNLLKSALGKSDPK